MHQICSLPDILNTKHRHTVLPLAFSPGQDWHLTSQCICSSSGGHLSLPPSVYSFTTLPNAAFQYMVKYCTLAAQINNIMKTKKLLSSFRLFLQIWTNNLCVNPVSCRVHGVELISKPLFNSLVITLGHMSVFPGELRSSVCLCRASSSFMTKFSDLLWVQHVCSTQRLLHLSQVYLEWSIRPSQYCTNACERTSEMCVLFRNVKKSLWLCW